MSEETKIKYPSVFVLSDVEVLNRNGIYYIRIPKPIADNNKLKEGEIFPFVEIHRKGE